MYCTECGAKNSADNKFCRQCGHSLEKARISEEAYTRALPDDEQAIELLETAYALRKKGETVEAVQTCERALQISPESAAAHSLLGQLYAAQGDRERAIREYEQVLRLNPGSIADRVKLDELRDEGLPKAKRAASVLPLAARENAAPSMMTLLSIGAAMIALIAAGVTLNRAGHSNNSSADKADKNVNRTVANNPAPSNPASVSAASTPDTVVTPTTSGAKPSVTTGGAPAPTTAAQALSANVFGPTAGLPAMKTNPAGLPTPGAASMTLPAINPPASAVAAAKSNPKNTGVKKTAPPTDNRIVLNGDEANSGDNNHYTIRINTGNGKNSGGTGKNSVTMAPNGGTAENPPAASSRSAISIADDFRYKGEYDKAIQMYQRALPGAGDGAAHIYQQMAYCFQEKGDKGSAKVNYERAIELYQKLAGSGQNAESAQSAIRVCQRGIKICE